MFLSKHSNGIYYIFYENAKGKRRSKSTGTKYRKDAEKFLNRYKKIIQEEFFQEVIPITLKRFGFDFLRRSEPFFTWKTVKIYQTTFKLLINHFGDIQLANLTSRMIEDYLLMRATKTSIYAARRDHICLNASFNKAVKDGYLTKNPCSGIKRFKLPQIQPKFFSKEDFEKLKAVMTNNEDMRDLVIFAVNTGLRQAELINLTWNQISWEQNIVTLTNQVHITKTKRIRSVPLNPDALEILIKRFPQKIDGLENVFTMFGKVINQDRISQNFKKYVYAAKIDSKLNFHSLRHTFASWLVQSGVSIYVVSKLLGHTNVTTTEVYSHLRSDDFKEAVQKIARKKITEESFIEH